MDSGSNNYGSPWPFWPRLRLLVLSAILLMLSSSVAVVFAFLLPPLSEVGLSAYGVGVLWSYGLWSLIFTPWTVFVTGSVKAMYADDYEDRGLVTFRLAKDDKRLPSLWVMVAQQARITPKVWAQTMVFATIVMLIAIPILHWTINIYVSALFPDPDYAKKTLELGTNLGDEFTKLFAAYGHGAALHGDEFKRALEEEHRTGRGEVLGIVIALVIAFFPVILLAVAITLPPFFAIQSRITCDLEIPAVSPLKTTWQSLKLYYYLLAIMLMILFAWFAIGGPVNWLACWFYQSSDYVNDALSDATNGHFFAWALLLLLNLQASLVMTVLAFGIIVPLTGMWAQSRAVARYSRAPKF